jgi:hypothetical protein
MDMLRHLWSIPVARVALSNPGTFIMQEGLKSCALSSDQSRRCGLPPGQSDLSFRLQYLPSGRLTVSRWDLLTPAGLTSLGPSTLLAVECRLLEMPH